MAVYHNPSTKDQDAEEKPIEMLETLDSDTEDTEKSSRPGKRGLTIDDEDLNMAVKSLYNTPEKVETEEIVGKGTGKVLKKEKSISFSETVSVYQENDRKERKRLKRAEMLQARRNARKAEEWKKRQKIKRERGRKFKGKKKEQHE